MARGRFGFPRPFAIEKELVTIRILNPEKINEATISSANGFIIGGELQPFFKIDNVYHLEKQAVEGKELKPHTNVNVDVEEDMLERGDVMVFISNIRDITGLSIFPDDVVLTPSISVNRRLVEESQIPKLIMKIQSNRGTQDEFEKEVSEAAHTYRAVDEILKFEEVNGTHVAFASSDGIKLSDANDISRDILGPRNKTVTTIHFDAIGIEENNV